MMSPRSLVSCVFTAALLASGFPACGDSESSTGEPAAQTGGSAGADASGEMCTMGSAQPVCQACANARCLAECRDCQSTQNCEPILACLKGKCAAECGGAPDASAGGSGGEAGQAGQAGEAGAPGEGGSGGEAGVAGSAGKGGKGGAAGGAGAPTTCPINFGIPACNSCIGDNCLDQCNNCAANADCVPLLTCIRKCNGDFMCEAQCRLTLAGGVGPEELLWGTFGCRKQNCATECAGPPQCGLQTGTAGCDTCINNQCFGECDTCANQQECAAIFQCVTKNCTAPYQKWCVQVCALQHPAASDAMGAFWGQLATPGCVESKCENECLNPVISTKCTLNTGAIACDTCIDTACMTECDACKANADCVAIYDCVKSQCAYPYNDAICVSSCTVKHLGGATLFASFWNGLTGCIGTKCGVICQ